jgi:hypothetical protein
MCLASRELDWTPDDGGANERAIGEEGVIARPVRTSG